MLRAAYGCMADINFDLIDSLAANELSGAAFWITMTKLFPSEDGDSRSSPREVNRRVARPGARKVVSSANKINTETKIQVRC